MISKINANSDAIIAMASTKGAVKPIEPQRRIQPAPRSSSEDTDQSADCTFIIDGLTNAEGNDLKTAVVAALNKHMAS